MSDFFKNISEVIKPLISTVAGKVDECQNNDKVDMPLFQNFATQLGMSEETYAQLEDTFFDLMDVVLDHAPGAVDLAASAGDKVIDIVSDLIDGDN